MNTRIALFGLVAALSAPAGLHAQVRPGPQNGSSVRASAHDVLPITVERSSKMENDSIRVTVIRRPQQAATSITVSPNTTARDLAVSFDAMAGRPQTTVRLKADQEIRAHFRTPPAAARPTRSSLALADSILTVLQAKPGTVSAKLPLRFVSSLR